MMGINLSQRDHKGGTPLHWAAFYGCEYAVDYLVSFKDVDINLTDNEGFTPLHLAALSGKRDRLKYIVLILN